MGRGYTIQHDRPGDPMNGPQVDRGQTSEATVALSEDAIALQFAGEHLDDLRYVAAWSRWYRWDDGGRWFPDQRLRTFNDARRICRSVARTLNKGKGAKNIASAKTVAAVERLARSDQRLAAGIDEWDGDPWLFNTPGGTMDLRTGILHPHRREDFITKLASASPGGDCRRWLTFIDTITGADAELAGFIQRMLGYALTGSSIEHALFFCFGFGSNGKSMLLSTVSGILADYATTAPIETFTATAGERHPTELAGLRGARLVTATETEVGRRWAEAKIKSLTGGDRIAARFMRQDFFEFTPQFKLIIAGNHKPALRTVDEAIRRRFYLVPFVVTIPPEERDPDLAEKLKNEWPGILRWMVDGCLDWQRRGLDPPAAVRDATAAYLEEEDVVATWLDECCVVDPDKWESSTELFVSWAAWAKAGGEAVGTHKAFKEKLEAHGFAPHRMNHGRGFNGLRLKPVMTV
jgi:putative DNA primase/helicase